MGIKYKKIIEEIMGEEARRRGYKIEAGVGLLVTRQLAIFSRVDGKGQHFIITKNLLEEGTLYLDCGQRISSYYTDETSFRKSISEFNEFMLDEGYKYLEKKLEEKHFTHEDSEYVKKNYKEIAIELLKAGVVIDKDNLKDSFESLFELLEEAFSKDWDSAIDTMYAVTAGITYLLVDNIFPIEIIDFDDTSFYYLSRKDGLQFTFSESPLHMVYATYKLKNMEPFLKKRIRCFFTEEELKEIGI